MKTTPEQLARLAEGGAVDCTACPTRRPRGMCLCERCAVCGFGKHDGIHGPIFGQPVGSKPWGHVFVAQEQTP